MAGVSSGPATDITARGGIIVTSSGLEESARVSGWRDIVVSMMTNDDDDDDDDDDQFGNVVFAKETPHASESSCDRPDTRRPALLPRPPSLDCPRRRRRFRLRPSASSSPTSP